MRVLVPWRGGCEHRVRAREWVMGQYDAHHPDWPLELIEGDLGDWRKGAVINAAARRCEPGEVIVIADADVWCDGIADALAAVQDGTARWAVPHRQVHRLTETSTAYLMSGCAEPLALPCDEDPYNGIVGGGIVVVRRDVLLDVPFDPRFSGWGGIDTSWRDAMLTLTGWPWRGRAPLFHLWHPPQERMNRMIGSQASHQLRKRYVRANRSPRKMRALLAEIDDLEDHDGGQEAA